jgi:hypothetical protein
MYKQAGLGSNVLARRLGSDVYEFLKQANNNDDFLTDYEYMKDNVKNSAQGWQLSDYAPLLLPLVKYYENSLWHICENIGLFQDINNGKRPYSLRNFFDTKEIEIENLLASKIQDQKQAKIVSRKLFSTIDDYSQRNEVVHCGQLIKYAELDNYDSLITKLKELVDCLFLNNVIQKN